MNKGFGLNGILIAILIILAIGTVGVYVVKKTDLIIKDTDDTTFVEKTQGDNNKQVVTEQPKDEVDETTDWKTYQNEEYGLEIKYPSMWTVNFKPETEKGDGTVRMCDQETNKGVSMVVAKNRNPNNLPIGELFVEEKNTVSPTEDLKKYKNIDGEKALIDHKDLGVFFTNRTNLFFVTRFCFASEPIDKELFDKILSTFKFID